MIDEELKDVMQIVKEKVTKRYILRGEEAKRRFGPICGSIVFVSEYPAGTFDELLFGKDIAESLKLIRQGDKSLSMGEWIDMGPIDG